MDFAALLENVWEKAGAFGVIAVALWITVRRVATWLEPKLTQAFAEHSTLVTSLTKTTAEQATANTANAENLTKITSAQSAQQRLLEELHQRVVAPTVKTCALLLVSGMALAAGLASHAEAGEPPIGASMRVTNGGTSCSGTVFSVGSEHAAAIGAAHCFSGRIGGEFDVLIGQQTVKATLIAVDKGKDLALWKLPASAVIEVAEFPDEQPQGPMTAIGYPAGVATAHVKKLKFRDQHEQGTRYDWQCEVVDGRFEGGDSGGGVFLDGRLAGVIHGKETKLVCQPRSTCRLVTYLHCVCFRDVREFVDSNAALIADCRGGQVPALAEGTPPPPSDKIYDGKGARPKDLGSDKCMAAEIDRLRHELAELRKLIELKPDPPAPVPGAKGERGANATDEQVAAAVEKWIAANAERLIGEHADKIRGSAGANGAPGLKGEPGSPGKPGASGRITVILMDAAGKEVSRAENLDAGSTVKLNVKRFQK